MHSLLLVFECEKWSKREREEGTCKNWKEKQLMKGLVNGRRNKVIG